MAIDVRVWREDDLPLILQSWRRVLRAQGPRWLVKPQSYGDPTYMPDAFFFRFVSPLLDAALYRTGAMVACSKTDSDLVYGFRVGDCDVTHFAFVKSPYRRLGIARALFEGVTPKHLYTTSTPTERRLRSRGKIPSTWRLSNDDFWRAGHGEGLVEDAA